jgi:hypothetical protein
MQQGLPKGADICGKFTWAADLDEECLQSYRQSPEEKEPPPGGGGEQGDSVTLASWSSLECYMG